jgi:tetratricopeptide (TPR) repeat protein
MFNKNPKRALMFVMGALVLIGFGMAQLYFNFENNKVDPRIIKARELYSNYDSLAQQNNFKNIFILLDSIENIYTSIEHYKNSYEVGVIQNNRAAAYLSMAIYFKSNSLSLDAISTLSKDSLIEMGNTAVIKSISTYENWLTEYAHKNESEIKNILVANFLHGLESYSDIEQSRFISKRVKEIHEAQIETPRRLSVAYTNLGIVNRHKENYRDAIKNYEYALKLWDRNLGAENNLNTLLGQPIKERNVLEKIFPPDKNN